MAGADRGDPAGSGVPVDIDGRHPDGDNFIEKFFVRDIGNDSINASFCKFADLGPLVRDDQPVFLGLCKIGHTPANAPAVGTGSID